MMWSLVPEGPSVPDHQLFHISGAGSSRYFAVLSLVDAHAVPQGRWFLLIPYSSEPEPEA